MTVPLSVTPSTLTLPDGRCLAWYDVGDPHGTPAVYLPGTPTSGLAGLLHDAAARRAGVRWISLDKPGYGGSSRQPHRGLTDLAADVARLADHLGIEDFVAVGESGGGPQALALAAGLGERVIGLVLLSSMGPNEGAGRRGMKLDNRLFLALAAHAPWLLRPILRRLGARLNDPARAATLADKHRQAMPAEERGLLAAHPDLLDLALAASADALRRGPDAALDELRLLTRPWGISLADVTAPVALWHGTADRHVPVQVAHRLVARLPHAKFHVVEGGGHSVGLLEIDAVMATVAASGRS
jgi:pimeloyl-ACP methyl ester carboxylesterase